MLPYREPGSTILLIILLFMCLKTAVAGEVCASHQFECASGRCIPFSWSCDGENDCDDSSDENEHCHGSVHCADTEFQCLVGKRCIPLRWQCDGEPDCEDLSDEDPTKCQEKKCTEDQFACKSRAGECIPLPWVCDKNADCSDATDEDGCNVNCTADEFTCANGRCIQKRWFCDGQDDCGDHSDEGDHCPEDTCPPDSNFNCGDNVCVPNKRKCDGFVDCANGADEADCPSLALNGTNQCTAQEFQCQNGIDCIHSSWQCDGDHDCPDGSDEHNCSLSTCRPDQFRCDDGECIPGHLQCSGAAECNDTSDEASCNSTTSVGCSPETEFDCGDGMCISLDKVCDGVNDCGQWEDEPKGKCNVNECALNNGGCLHTCIDTTWGFRCECHPGYALSNNSTCVDIDECLDPGTCSQTCTNEKGSFKCECISGYTRDPHDHTHCKANEGHSALLFTHGTDIRRFALDRRDLTSIVNETRSSTALDFHFESGMLYWSDINDRRIYKAPIDEGETKTVVASGHVVKADGLAVDWIYRHLYWTDSSKESLISSIQVSDLDGGSRKTLLTEGLQQPRSIAVDPLEGWLYWSDWGGASRIERSGLDGSHRQVLIDSHIKWPNGITLDRVDRRLFWVDAKMDMIGSCDYDGSNRRVVLSSGPAIGHPFAVTVFEDWIYWTDWDHRTIMRANKFNGKNATSVTQTHSSQMPMVVHVYHSYRQPSGPNHCMPFNGRCSHLCLPAPQINDRSAKISCACPDNFQMLDDGLNCVETHLLLRNTSTTSTTTSTTIAVKVNDTLKSNSEDVLQSLANDSGTITGLIIGTVAGIIILIALVGFFVYRHVVLRNATSMNFDNPVYRKTTEDKFSLSKNPPSGRSKASAPEVEPLNHPGTNEYV